MLCIFLKLYYSFISTVQFPSVQVCKIHFLIFLNQKVTANVQTCILQSTLLCHRVSSPQITGLSRLFEAQSPPLKRQPCPRKVSTEEAHVTLTLTSTFKPQCCVTEVVQFVIVVESEGLICPWLLPPDLPTPPEKMVRVTRVFWWDSGAWRTPGCVCVWGEDQRGLKTSRHRPQSLVPQLASHYCMVH